MIGFAAVALRTTLVAYIALPLPAGLICKTEIGQKNKQENDAKALTFRVPLNADCICFSVSESA